MPIRADLFSSISPTAFDATALAFGRILVRRIHLKHADQGWSLAELHTTEADYHWLQEWMKSIRSTDLGILLSTWSGSLDQTRRYRNIAVSGTLFWLLFAEHARRRGTEGSFWHTISALPWPSRIGAVFFLQDGNPTGVMRSTLQAAAEALMLRNVFGVDGTMPWFDTGFMQFGFTRTGFERRLPEWLAGQTPTLAIRHLLGQAGASLASRTFIELWSRLTAYRRKNLGEQALRTFLGSSPWILPDWIDSVVKKSRERPSLDSAYCVAPDDDLPIQFLDTPKLEWSIGVQPSFTAEWINLDSLVLTAPTYVLRWANRELGRIVRQADGSFATTTGPKVNFGWIASRGIATLEAVHDRSVAAAQPLILWDEAELVNLYDTRGHRAEDAYQAEHVPAQNGFTLCLPTFVTLTGVLPESWPLPQQPFLLARFPKDSGRLAVAADGEELWSSDLLGTAPPALSSGDVTVRLKIPDPFPRFAPWEPTPTLRMNVECASGLELRWIKWADQPLMPAAADGQYTVEIHPRQLSLPVTVTFGLSQKGRVFVARQRVEVSFTGTLWRTGPKVRVLVPSKLLPVRAAMTDEFRFRLPLANPADHDHLYLVEAGSVVRRMTPHPAPIGKLAGYGGKLVIRKGPYNEARDTLLVAEQVIDGGILRNVTITSTAIQLLFIQEVPLRSEHAVLIWNSRHEIIRVEAVVGSDPLTWEVPHQGQHGSIFAIGVFFNGVRLGSWFNLENWSSKLRFAETMSEVRHAAVVLRWFHAPILAELHVGKIRAFLHRNLGAALSIWLSDHDEELSGYTFGAMPLDAPWTNALEELVGRGGTRVDERTAKLVFDAMNPGAELHDCNDAVVRLVQRLTMVSSQLASSFCKAWLEAHFSPVAGKQAALELKAHLKEQLRPTSNQWQVLGQNVLRVAPEFLERLAQKEINPMLTRTPTDVYNLQLLAKHPTFRRHCVAMTL